MTHKRGEDCRVQQDAISANHGLCLVRLVEYNPQRIRPGQQWGEGNLGTSYTHTTITQEQVGPRPLAPATGLAGPEMPVVGLPYLARPEVLLRDRKPTYAGGVIVCVLFCGQSAMTKLLRRIDCCQNYEKKT